MERSPPDDAAGASRQTCDQPPRRRFLRSLVGLGAGVLGGVWLAGVVGSLGCRRSADEEGAAGAGAAAGESRFPLASLPPGERVRVIHQGRPVELRQEGDRVVARSLTCTHFACEVRWRPDEEDYLCPCHDGRFAPNGRVLGGPPSLPLPEVPVRIEGSTVVLGG